LKQILYFLDQLVKKKDYIRGNYINMKFA